MGIVTGGVFGDVKNAVGNVVFSFWKGRNTIRKKAGSIANPRTTPQVNQRSKFKASSKLFSSILGVWVKPLWDRFSGNITGYNAIMKTNTETFNSDGTPDYSALIMSKGKMVQPSVTGIVADTSLHTIVTSVTLPEDVTWGQPNSTLYAVAFNATTDEFIGSANKLVSPDTTTTITIDSDFFTTGDEVYVYIAVKRADGTQVSDAGFDSVVAIA